MRRAWRPSGGARGAWLLALTACGLGSGACGEPRDPVERLLARIEAAVESRDADALGETLASDFEGRDGMSRERALDTARRFLLGYEEAAVEIYEVSQQPTDDGARVSFWVEFTGRARQLGGLSGLLPPGAVYVFEMDLRRREPDWLVFRASWEQRAGADAGVAGVSSDSEGGAR